MRAASQSSQAQGTRIVLGPAVQCEDTVSHSRRKPGDGGNENTTGLRGGSKEGSSGIALGPAASEAGGNSRWPISALSPDKELQPQWQEQARSVARGRGSRGRGRGNDGDPNRCLLSSTVEVCRGAEVCRAEHLAAAAPLDCGQPVHSSPFAPPARPPLGPRWVGGPRWAEVGRGQRRIPQPTAAATRFCEIR